MRRFAAGVAALVFLTTAAVAGAQEWLRDRSTSEGQGIKLGDALVLHLGLGLEAGYDTNALYAADDPDQAIRLRVTPYVDLGTRSVPAATQGDADGAATAAQKAQFRLGLATYYDHHFPVGASNDAAVNQINGLNALGVDTNMQLVVFPQGKFSFLLDASYLRTQQAYETSDDAGRARHDITPGIGFRIRPGGGTLTIEPGYRLQLQLFEDAELAKENDRHAHDVRLYVSWKVFPKTALVSRINFTPTFYMYGESDKENSLPIRSLFGLQGLVAAKFGLLLLVGYGASNYAAGPNFSSVIAQAELMFFITPVSSIRVGGERDFVDSYYANFYTKNGGYLSYSQLFGGVFLATIKGDVSGRQYATYRLPSAEGNATPSSPNRVDVWAGGTLSLEYRATAWLSILASARYSADITDFGFTLADDPDTAGDESGFFKSSFQKFEAFLGVKGHY
jgi:hypothetical protein